MNEPTVFEPAAPEEDKPYVLHLFVAGASLHSTRAISNLKRICDTYLPGQYTLDIVDIYQQKARAQAEQLIALPMLIKRFPLPERRLVGDMSDTKKVLTGLGLPTH
ncbi:circadian clock KaiB family protein [Spirosoma humi]